MKKKAIEILTMAAMLGGGFPDINVKGGNSNKTFKKPLEDYRIPPRSMTPEEREYYKKHKHLNGF